MVVYLDKQKLNSYTNFMGNVKKSNNRSKGCDLSDLELTFKKVYDSWGEKTFCPSLGEHIYFTDTGWNHIRKGTRTKSETERRLKLLPLSKRLIGETPDPPTRHIRTFRGRDTIYYKLQGTLDKIKVAVILIKLRGRFTFLSNFEEYKK